MMNYIYASVGIILAFVWCIFIMNEQRYEIISLKAQLQIANDYVRDMNDSEHQLVQCIHDVDFLKQGLEEVIAKRLEMR